MLDFIRNLDSNYIFMLGVIIGSFITSVIIKKSTKYAGVLKIDRHNPDKDLYFIEIEALEELTRAKEITLKVDNNADLSRK